MSRFEQINTNAPNLDRALRAAAGDVRFYAGVVDHGLLSHCPQAHERATQAADKAARALAARLVTLRATEGVPGVIAPDLLRGVYLLAHADLLSAKGVVMLPQCARSARQAAWTVRERIDALVEDVSAPEGVL